MSKLSAAEIESNLDQIADWSRVGDAIRRVYVFPDFVGAVGFVNKVADEAERAWHHPDIDIRWNKVTLTLSTHDAGGLTAKDFALAAACDQLAQ